MLIRAYEPSDWPGVWAVLEPIFRAGETYAFPVDITEADARRKWTQAAHEVFVAQLAPEGPIAGTYYLKPNQEGPGAHVCNCGYAVAREASGQGVAAAMCEHSQRHASERGFRAMQFNLVAASNHAAVHLWSKLGFTIVGTLPGAFHHPNHGFVDAHIMYKPLQPATAARRGA